MLRVLGLSHCRLFMLPYMNKLCSYRFFAVAARAQNVPGAKKKYIRDKPHMNIGTIGHVDHGKTTLTAALTKVLSENKQAAFKTYEEIDSAPEEIRRGITINAATVDYSTAERHYAHTDCPGHADYIKNMITGVNQMDCAIIVVAATDGTMPQTKEHLLLAKQIGIEHLVVFINKADAADEEMLELVELEIRDNLNHYGFNGELTPVISGSALCALEGRDPEIGQKKVIALLEEVDKIPLPKREIDKPFLLPIEQTMSITGRGVVSVGRVERGVVKQGDTVEILGYDKRLKSVVTGIETFHQILERAEPGDQVGVLLRGIKREDIRRGMAIAAPKTAEMHNNVKTQIYMLTKEEGGRNRPITPGFQAHVYSKSWDCPSVVELLNDKEMVMPGEDAHIMLNFQRKMVMEPGQRFTMRTSGVTFGYGVISEVLPDADTSKWEKK